MNFMKKVVRFILEFLACVSMATSVGTALESQPNLVVILATSVTAVSAYILFQITK